MKAHLVICRKWKAGAGKVGKREMLNWLLLIWKTRFLQHFTGAPLDKSSVFLSKVHYYTSQKNNTKSWKSVFLRKDTDVRIYKWDSYRCWDPSLTRRMIVLLEPLRLWSFTSPGEDCQSKQGPNVLLFNSHSPQLEPERVVFWRSEVAGICYQAAPLCPSPQQRQVSLGCTRLYKSNLYLGFCWRVCIRVH